MAKIVQTRRGTTEQHKGFDGQQGEITIDLTENTIRVHDGSVFPENDPSGYLLARSDMSNVSNVVGIIQLNLADGTDGQVIATDGSGTIAFSSSPDVSGSIISGDLSGTIGDAQIIPQVVGTTELTDFNVTRIKLEADVIDNTKLDDNAVQTENIVNQHIVTSKIADFNVTRIKLEADAVDNSKLADNAVQTENMVDGSVTVEKLSAIGLLPALDGSQLINIITVPEGLIAMWSGAIINIPIGWAICDGGNGTPDLRNRFIIGAGSTHVVDATGGSTDTGAHTLTIAQMPAHTHSYFNLHTAGSADTSQTGGLGGQSIRVSGSTGGGGSHTHSGSLPPFYALAYIMRLAEGAVAIP